MGANDLSRDRLFNPSGVGFGIMLRCVVWPCLPQCGWRTESN